jgi:hypothetical protein
VDKFIIRPYIKTTGYKPVVIDVNTHEKLMQMKEDSGVSIGRLIALMADFCAERMVVEEE